MLVLIRIILARKRLNNIIYLKNISKYYIYGKAIRSNNEVYDKLVELYPFNTGKQNPDKIVKVIFQQVNYEERYSKRTIL